MFMIWSTPYLGWSFRIRWLWLDKIGSSWPWAELPIQIPQNAQALFKVAVESIVGNGEHILFWSDRWLGRNTVCEMAPNLLKTIAKRVIKQRTVAQALEDRRWVSNIKGRLSVPVLREYLLLWDLVDNMLLQEGVEDQHQWKLTRSGIYSSKSTYNAYFIGSIRFAP